MRVLLAVGLMSAPLAASASDNSLITQFCKTAVKAELHRAGTVPPEGMVDDTCRCFLAEVQNGVGIQTGPGHLQGQGRRDLPPLIPGDQARSRLAHLHGGLWLNQGQFSTT